MSDPTLTLWLQERTALGILPVEVLEAIARIATERVLPTNQQLATADTHPETLYILKQGRLESAATSASSLFRERSFLPGAALYLEEILLDRPIQQTIVALTECHLWAVPAAAFRQLVSQNPQIFQAFSQQLARQLERMSAQLTYEQERQIALRPYLIAKVKRGVVGNSRYAVRLRKQIIEASRDRQSVLIFGEPGLEKDNLAALIHFSSPQRRQPAIQVNSGILPTSGVELFGREGGKPGLLELVGEGTVVLNNIQDLPPELLPKVQELLRTGTYTPIDRSGASDPTPRPCHARIVAIAETSQPAIERHIGRTIKAPPLRVRKADIQAYIDYFLSILCRQKGLPKPRVTPEALRRLQSYDFPNNLRELQGIVERAVVQAEGGLELTEEIFWSVQTKKKRFRLNLLNGYPQLRRFLRSPWWPNRLNYGFTLGFFAFIVLVLFLGPQHRSENFALNLFWAWWWPLVLLGFPFVGRLWCAICPFMIYGELLQTLSLKLFPRQLQRWQREKAERWGGWFLFGLFVLIFLWEELWHLEDTAYLSSCLLLLITAGAVICSQIFERRFWCRYLCPIGGMNGLFAKLSITELRAQQGICGAECTTYQCYKGGPQKGEGMETEGCPLYSHPAQLTDNRDCVLCMTCLKACPHRSVELNLRPPGIELWTTHVPRTYEVALLLLLLGGIFLHRLPEIQTWLGIQVDLSQFFPHLTVSLGALLLPATVPFLAYGAIQLLASWLPAPKPRSLVELTYGYLPLVLGGTLAHYLYLGLGEAGRILPVTLATFGLSGEGAPVLVAHPAVIAFLQGTTLIAGTFLSMVLTQKIARQPLRWLLPQHVATVILAASMWVIIVG